MYSLNSDFRITSEQKRVVDDVVRLYRQRIERQILLGVTGSGKTFTMANIIRELGIPALVLSPNKTLAAQLYQEFRGFFPRNRVGYFISYYDYYQPEAFVPARNMYIAKEVSINPELERLRIEAVRSALETRYTVIIASVSAIYSIGSPDEFFEQKVSYSLSTPMQREKLIREFVTLGYRRTDGLVEAGCFRVRGDIVEIFPSSEEEPLRFILVNDKQICAIETFDAVTGETLMDHKAASIYPISYFHYHADKIRQVLGEIRQELSERVHFFRRQEKNEFADRLQRRTMYDLELLEQYGTCPGIENYSRFLTGRKQGEPPYTLLDFFNSDFLTIIDESHITVPQLRGMYAGDRSRKQTLVDFGFRLPSALDNRPLHFDEIHQKLKKILYVSATPAPFEHQDTENHVTELLVRPTGLLDPEIDIRKSASPVADLRIEIQKTVAKGERVLVTTLTKKMAERLATHLSEENVRCTYMHSEIKPLDRVKIIHRLRTGEIDVLIGINLLREGLDLPEVSLVAILNADQEGFLRTETSLIQTFGRASRNVNGRVILYIQQMTESLQRALEETERRRDYQIEFNKTYDITPATINKKIKNFHDDAYWLEKTKEDITVQFRSQGEMVNEIDRLTVRMKEMARNLDFKGAAELKERIKYLKNTLLELF